MPSPVVFVFEAKVGDLTSEWPTMLRKKRASPAVSSGFCSFLPVFNRWTSIILGLFRLDSLADYAPEYVALHATPYNRGHEAFLIFYK